MSVSPSQNELEAVARAGVVDRDVLVPPASAKQSAACWVIGATVDEPETLIEPSATASSKDGHVGSSPLPPPVASLLPSPHAAPASASTPTNSSHLFR